MFVPTKPHRMAVVSADAFANGALQNKLTLLRVRRPPHERGNCSSKPSLLDVTQQEKSEDLDVIHVKLRFCKVGNKTFFCYKKPTLGGKNG